MDLQEFLSQNPAWQSHPDLILRPPSPAEISAWFPEVSPELLQRSDELIRHCGLSLTRGALYSHIRHSQQSSDRWAAMLALQSPPGLKDNATFMAGRKPWYEHADPRYVEKVKGILKAKGVELTSRHEYCPELARYTGDPEAVLPHGQERDHIKKICERRGWACILPDQEMQGQFIGASKSWYSGQAVEVTCLSGAKLAVTANHPVVTVKGFAPAGQLRKHQYLLRYIGKNHPNTLSHDEQYAPTSAENVFSSLKNVSGSILADTKLVCGSLDFHGEAQFFQGNIEAVGTYSELALDLVSQASQGLSNSDLIRGGSQELGLPSSRRLNSRLHGSASPGRSSMGGCDLLEPLVGGVFAPAEPASFGYASQCNAILPKGSGQSGSVDSGDFSQFIECCSGFVAMDKIVKIRNFSYNGHVFDFHSPFGWVVANNICISNCHGAVECEHRQPDTDPHQSGPRMAEDLIRQKAQLLTDRDPSLKKLSRQDLRAKVLDKFGPST